MPSRPIRMDKLEQPEINTSELTAEVRKAMARQVLKRHALPTNPSATEAISPPANAPEEDNSTRAKRLSTDMNFDSLQVRLSSLPKSPRFELHPAFEPNTADEYHLNELLRFHDADFV